MKYLAVLMTIAFIIIVSTVNAQDSGSFTDDRDSKTEKNEYGFFDGLIAPAEAMVNFVLIMFGDETASLGIIGEIWENGNFMAKLGVILGFVGILLLIGGAGLRRQISNFSSSKKSKGN